MKDVICCSLNKEDVKQLVNSEYSDEMAIDIFKALAHPLRLKIIRLLVFEPEICTCEITELFDESQPFVSKQLTKLTDEGLLTRRTITQKGIAGKWHAYRLVEEKRKLISSLVAPFSKKKLENLV
ncbi:MAG: ArsR/SmtB family transcription factor [Candidatus Hermodarchaeota archaeon]